ncbi:MAG: trypsin-like peptidase domain-containing protein [Cyanobacteria bacterium]|nr:trypsin-like peptidase domain-containing protein [Cyanobacteriota bacterium]
MGKLKKSRVKTFRPLLAVEHSVCNLKVLSKNTTLFATLLLTVSFLTTPGFSEGYTPQYDVTETENISVYDTANKTVVSINTLVNGAPSSGSGVIIDTSGLIITSSHVIGSAQQVSVSLEGGQRLKGKVIARIADKTDLALIQIQAPIPLMAIKLGDSTQVKVGQRVLAIGNPYGFERTLTSGIVSRIDKLRNRLQTDAAINPGNSGGPLLDTQGYLIGINQSIYNPEGNRSNIGIGFAVPINTVKDFVKTVTTQLTNASPQTIPNASNQHPSIQASLPKGVEGMENVSHLLEAFSKREGL